MFGGTLALKGAIDEQRATKPAHCEEGCYGCQLEAHFMFADWLKKQARSQAASAAHEHVHFNLTPRIP